MAGAGYKLFQTGSVLTAADVNTYLNEQTVMVFADSTARTTALSSVLAEGMMSYLQDTNSVEVYNGSAWVSVGSTGDITGVTAGTGISGGGTSGDVTITNSMATAIDAKGDLIVGTGDNAFSRLAVGTNNFFLRANSSTSTGLDWGGSWTTYTPVISQNGNRTATINYAKYLQIGNFVVVQVDMTPTNAGTANNRIGVTLPLTAASSSVDRCYGSFTYADAGTAYYVGSVGLQTTTLAYFVVHNAQDFLGVSPNFAIANGDRMAFTIVYEVA